MMVPVADTSFIYDTQPNMYSSHTHITMYTVDICGPIKCRYITYLSLIHNGRLYRYMRKLLEDLKRNPCLGDANRHTIYNHIQQKKEIAEKSQCAAIGSPVVGCTSTRLKARPYMKNKQYSLFTGDLSLLI